MLPGMKGTGFLLGLDIGSSSVKATLLDIERGKRISSAIDPEQEMEIIARESGWAEQDPAKWWQSVKKTVSKICTDVPNAAENIRAIGISYQMHGLVCIDRQGELIRPSIIWCDSRAVPYGDRAFAEIGTEKCLTHLLNSPGNFTAAKLAWVKENEPESFAKIWKFMLPGDYIAYKMTGSVNTTPSGLSEGILWDFIDNGPAGFLAEYFEFPDEIFASQTPTFSHQGELSSKAAKELGIKMGIPVTYRAGDQPNNAFSLNVLEPGELAATAGTSGVVYGIDDKATYDPASRVNTFVHVNHHSSSPRYGVLLCLNGTGILNMWLKQVAATIAGEGMSYPEMNEAAAGVPIGSDGIVILPYGNGAERTLENRDIDASIHGLNFNRHSKQHLFRAGQEGIVFALNYGVEIMRGMGMDIRFIKAGYANMFLSPLFRTAFATTTETHITLYNTDGSEGAARGAGVGLGVYTDFKEAFTGLEKKEEIEPDVANSGAYRDAYGLWIEKLEASLGT
jgi:xylulokinase